MSTRLLFALVSLAAALVMGAATTSLRAAPISKAASSQPFAERSHLTKVEYGCGWDTACPPRPWYGQRSYRTPHVYIENNYGTVNVYRTPRRSYRQPAYSSWRWREREYDGRRDYDDWRGYKRCDGDACAESCGIVCWYRRIRDGYCGHGCDAYREQARYERDYPDCRDENCPRYRDEDYPRYRDESYTRCRGGDYTRCRDEDYARCRGGDYPRCRDEDYARPTRYRTSPRDRYDDAPARNRYDAPPVRFERPSNDERVPLRRFSGPKYP